MPLRLPEAHLRPHITPWNLVEWLYGAPETPWCPWDPLELPWEIMKHPPNHLESTRSLLKLPEMTLRHFGIPCRASVTPPRSSENLKNPLKPPETLLKLLWNHSLRPPEAPLKSPRLPQLHYQYYTYTALVLKSSPINSWYTGTTLYTMSWGCMNWKSA